MTNPWLLPCLPVVVMVLCAGCGERRPLGEPGGVPVGIAIDLDAAYVRGMSHASPAAYPHGYLVHDAWYPSCDPGSRYRYFGRGQADRPVFFYHDPFWDEPRFTDVYLLGGDGPAEAGVFRQGLGYGHQDISVLIRPGHVVTLTVQARGDRDGWEAVGHFTASGRPGQRVALTLSADGPRMVVTDPPSDTGVASDPAPGASPPGSPESSPSQAPAATPGP